MKILKRFTLAALAVIAMSACSCTVGRLANGGVSETTNGVAASIVYPDGKPSANSIVRLRPHDYLAPFPGNGGGKNPLAIDSVTDSLGRFHIPAVSPGEYVIEVVDNNGNAIALYVVVTNSDSLVNLGTDTVRPVGAVSGTIASAPPGLVYIQVQGLEYVASVNSEAAEFICTKLPPGNFDLRIISAAPDSLSKVVPGVIVTSNDTTDIGPASLLVIAPPTGLSYTHNPVTYETNAAITPDTAVMTGTTAVDSFTVAPALPAGLSLAKTTGIITGTPTTATASATYTVTAKNAAGAATAALTITVTPGQFTKRIVLNTAQSGAGVSETVTGFPVLIHLTSATLDFSRTRSNGENLYFLRSGTTSLPYEIEQWDSLGQTALVWLKVDTLYGNNDTQSVLMVWGNPGTLLHGSGAVFDTAQGFVGVWHMDEPGAVICPDATVNHYDGTPYGMTASSVAPGAIGNAQVFDSASASYIRMNGTAQSKLDFSENGVYTISAWVNADTIDYAPHLIAGKGHEQYYLKMMTNDSLKTLTWENVEYHGMVGWQITENPATARTWKYVVGVRNGTDQRIYVDGVLADSIPRTIAGTIARNTSEDFSIGAYLRFINYLTPEGYCYFNGKIDEVRVSGRARSQGWIKLCYENQSAADALVQFK